MKGQQQAVLALMCALVAEAAGRAVTPLRAGANTDADAEGLQLAPRARLALLERDLASLQKRIAHEQRVRTATRGAAGAAGAAGSARGSARGGGVLDEDDDGAGCGSEGRARYPQFGSDTSEFVFTGSTRDMAPNATVRAPAWPGQRVPPVFAIGAR